MRFAYFFSTMLTLTFEIERGERREKLQSDLGAMKRWRSLTNSTSHEAEFALPRG